MEIFTLKFFWNALNEFIAELLQLDDIYTDEGKNHNV